MGFQMQGTDVVLVRGSSGLDDAMNGDTRQTPSIASQKLEAPSTL